MPILREQVLHVAALARLDLDAEEVDRLTTELDRILAHIDQLASVDTQGVAPNQPPGLSALPLAADEPRPGLSPEEALSPAPATLNSGFAVPAFIDD